MEAVLPWPIQLYVYGFDIIRAERHDKPHRYPCQTIEAVPYRPIETIENGI